LSGSRSPTDIDSVSSPLSQHLQQQQQQLPPSQHRRGPSGQLASPAVSGSPVEGRGDNPVMPSHSYTQPHVPPAPGSLPPLPSQAPPRPSPPQQQQQPNPYGHHSQSPAASRPGGSELQIHPY